MSYWVVRVVLHEGRPVQLSMLSPGMVEVVALEVDAGAFALLPDGSICEPIEGFDLEHEAHECRVSLLAKHPTTDFRVTMSVCV